MSEFFALLVFFGPLTAASYFVSGFLLPGAAIIALFSTTKKRAPFEVLTVGAVCLAVTIVVTHPAARQSPTEFAMFFTAIAIPLAIQAILLGLCVRGARRLFEWIDKKALDVPNQ